MTIKKLNLGMFQKSRTQKIKLIGSVFRHPRLAQPMAVM
jgi:hypothetical protein